VKGANGSTSAQNIALIVVIIAVALAASLAIVVLRAPPKEAISVEEFGEFDEISIDIDASGDASCRLVIQMPPSKLADLLKQLTPLVGIDEMRQSYIESLRGSFARYGLEMRDPTCDIDMGENFTITMRWEIPAIARWEGNRWTVTLEWVDDQSAAEQTIAELEDVWVFVRNVAQMHNIQSARYKITSKTVSILPENVGDVRCQLLGSSRTIDLGGGSYSVTSLYLENTIGRPAIVENGLTLIVTENELTITPQRLIENSMFYTINYVGAYPENFSFASSMEQVRLDLKYGRELGEQYLIYSGGSWYSLSPAQVLYYAADAIDNYDQGGHFSIQQPISVEFPDHENGDWGACWKDLSKDEYIGLAKKIRDNIKFTGKAPAAIQTSIGNIRFRDVLFTFTRILSSYRESGKLPNAITFAPAPTGELTRGNKEIPANYAYFLLPDTYVITGTSKVKEVLDNVYEVGYDDRRFAEELCNWAGTNITYSLSYSTPTSEEVLESRTGQCRDYANVYLALARTAGIPARRVSGWVVSTWQPPAGWEFIVGTTPEGKPIGGHAWTEVYLPNGWTPVDPTANRFEDLGYQIYKQMEQTWIDALAGYETGRGLI
jgi:transglutaminase-like putative cysteine protease